MLISRELASPLPQSVSLVVDQSSALAETLRFGALPLLPLCPCACRSAAVPAALPLCLPLRQPWPPGRPPAIARRPGGEARGR